MTRIDRESVKKSSNSPIYDAPEETDAFESSKALCVDKSVTECEPQVVVGDKETNHNIIKDICVDEGGPTKDKILFGRKVDAKIYNLFSYLSCKNKDTTKHNIGTNVLNHPATEQSDQAFSKDYLSKEFMQQNEDATQKLSVALADNVYEEVVEPGDKSFSQELNIEKYMPSSVEEEEIERNHDKVGSESKLHSEPDKSKTMIEEEAAPGPALELAVDESNTCTVDKSSLSQKNGSTNIVDKSGLPEENASIDVVDKSSLRQENATNEVDEKLGESAFSSLGAISGRISHSESAPYSGSISLRSDSSTTSTQSFAFPILQTEWNCSPVRMAKGNRRHSRGWKRHIFCCRF